MKVIIMSWLEGTEETKPELRAAFQWAVFPPQGNSLGF
jgi:hypothetical protein